MAQNLEKDMAWAPGTRRETLLTLGVSPAMHIGVEIGAANNPIIPAHIGTCRYVDYMTTEQLRERLADYPYRDSLVAIDYVWSGSGSLVDRIGADRFDYAIASHVIEHVPNPVGWFSGIYEALKPGARFNLAIPDRRFTFDICAPESSLGEFVEAALLNYERPSARQVFDCCYYGKAIEPGNRWSDKLDVQSVPAFTGDIAPALALQQAREAIQGTYFDSHCWVFTPDSFLRVLRGLCLVGMFPFELVDFHPTIEDEFEFFLCLERPLEALAADALLARQIARIDFFEKAIEERNRRSRLLIET